MKRRHILLLNQASGGNQRGLDAGEVAANVEEIFRAAGHEIESVLVGPGKVESALENAMRAKPDVIIVAGGDGTVSTAARLLGGGNIAMGILPMGTFNLAARDLGVPLTIPEAAEFLAAAEILPVDILDVNGHACLCTTILGFYPEYAGIFEKRDHGGRWWKKTLKLLRSLPSSFSKSRPLELRWEDDHGPGRARTKFAAFVPGNYRASAGLVPSRTDVCSGLMTAYIGLHQRPAAALKGIFDYALGRHELNPDLKIFKTRTLLLRAHRRLFCTLMLDGEILKMKFPIRFEILPARLKVLSTASHLAPEAAVES